MTNEQIEEELKAYSDEQELSDEDKALRDLIYDRFEIFESNTREIREKAAECRQIVRMKDPKQDDAKTLKKNGKQTLQLQTLKSTFNNVVADQMLSQPEIKCLPETADKQAAADDIQDMVHFVMYCANNFPIIHHKLAKDFYGAGTVILQTTWDQDMNYGKGEIALIRWPIESFLWDTMADNIQDCRAVMKVSWHPLSWYRAHWPEAGKYVGSEEGERNNVALSDVTENRHPGDEQRALLIEYWWRSYDASKRRYSINVAYAAGNALLEVQKDVYNHGLYPFTVLEHDSIEGSIAGDSLVEELAPMMRYINRYASYADMNARMSSKGRMIVRRGSGIDREALKDWETDIIEGDSIDQGINWNWMQNQPFNSTITNLMTMFESDLKADSGANQFTRGETTGGIVSGKAINSLIQAGGKVSSMRTEQIKAFCKDVGEQIIWLMSQFYDNNRVMMITGREGQKELKVDAEKLFGRKTKGAVNPPPYTVQIEISSHDPQRIANKNQMLMEAFTMSAQTDSPMRLSDLFRLLNLDGKDQILPVIEANEHYAEMMMQMQQQMERMGQQMQQLQAENQGMRKQITNQTNAMASLSADPPVKDSAIVNGSQNMMGVQTGAPLPT